MPLAADVDIKTLVSRPTGYAASLLLQFLLSLASADVVLHSEHAFTGADLAAVCKEAAFRSLRQDIDATSVSMDHFIAAWDQRTRKSSADHK